MRIVPGTDPIPVEHPIFLIVGQPGICKTSLGYSMPDPLLLDFDEGAHRAINRRDTGVIKTWADAADIEEDPKILDPYKSLVIDTVGRCVDKMAIDIIEKDGKMGRGAGELSLQGYGRLKSRFRSWMMQTRAHGRDVLLLAHDKEDKDGDDKIVRADIVGGSYAEIMRVADFVGYLYMNGKDRILDFNPTSRWVGKNPGQWKPFQVPPPEKATEFMANLYAKGREVLGRISQASASVQQQVEEWRGKIAEMTCADDFNLAVPHVQALQPATVQAPVKKLLMDAATSKGCTFDKKAKKFSDPPKPKEPEPAAVAGQDLGW